MGPGRRSERRSFIRHCEAASVRLGHQRGSYLPEHEERLHATWELCRGLVGEGSSLLSIGAGSAFVESALAARGVRVTVVDFPQAIGSNAAYYEASGIVAVAADVSEPLGPELGEFDAVLAGEIVEHVPAPPAGLFRSWSQPIRAGGHLVVSTPNLGSISSLVRLLFMRPLLAPPERTFGPVSFENEGVHRREYMPSEIKSAFIEAGLRPGAVVYCRNHRPHNARETAYLPLQLIPRFRPTLIAAAVKPASPSSPA